MGSCLSVAAGAPSSILGEAAIQIQESDYHKQYLEDGVLGQGEFGIVKLVHDVSDAKDRSGCGADNRPMACKILNKGVVFKDNVLYTPLKPQILRQEVNILQTLAGQAFCLNLYKVYETPRHLYLMTEYLSGGEMMEYVASQETLGTEDVSRIAFQLLSAVHHCAKNGILHRDIKPENVMFLDKSPGAELRVIDFGSGVLDKAYVTATADDCPTHTTFAGSAFYISPEMFQRTYTTKTDVWSVGVALYVLVAGYPADCLQKAFNMLQSSNRDLRKLPNLPSPADCSDIPDSYFDLLEKLLEYRHKRRVGAGDVLNHEFCQFYKVLQKEQSSPESGPATTASAALSLDQIAAVAASAAATSNGSTTANGTTNNNSRMVSRTLRGSVHRHNIFLGFKKFERSLTALLATMLTKKEFQQLIDFLAIALKQQQQQTEEKEKIERPIDDPTPVLIADSSPAATTNTAELGVMIVQDLKKLLREKFPSNSQLLETIDKLPNANAYERFAYNITLLQDFNGDQNAKRVNASAPFKGGMNSTNPGQRGSKRGKFLDSSDGNMDRTNGSVQSASSFRGFRKKNNSSRGGTFAQSMFASSGGGGPLPSTIHGTNAFNNLKKQQMAQ